MNRSCYVSRPPVSCSATDGKRDGEGKRERVSEGARSPCVMYPMLPDVCEWHPKPSGCRGEVLVSIGTETTLTFSLTTFTSAEGRWRWGISSDEGQNAYLWSRGSQEVQRCAWWHSSTTNLWPKSSCLPHYTLSLLPPSITFPEDVLTFYWFYY